MKNLNGLKGILAERKNEACLTRPASCNHLLQKNYIWACEISRVTPITWRITRKSRDGWLEVDLLPSLQFTTAHRIIWRAESWKKLKMGCNVPSGRFPSLSLQLSVSCSTKTHSGCYSHCQVCSAACIESFALCMAQSISQVSRDHITSRKDICANTLGAILVQLRAQCMLILK